MPFLAALQLASRCADGGAAGSSLLCSSAAIDPFFDEYRCDTLTFPRVPPPFLDEDTAFPCGLSREIEVIHLYMEALGAGTPQTRTVLQHDGPDHLGLWCDAAPLRTNQP